jgi:hypothetical protein
MDKRLNEKQEITRAFIAHFKGATQTTDILSILFNWESDTYVTRDRIVKAIEDEFFRFLSEMENPTYVKSGIKEKRYEDSSRKKGNQSVHSKNERS